MLASSLFPYWHFRFCLERKKKVREYSPCYFQPAGKKITKQIFVLLTKILNGLSLQGVDCHSDFIQAHIEQHGKLLPIINYVASQQHQRPIHSPGNTQNEVLFSWCSLMAVPATHSFLTLTVERVQVCVHVSVCGRR